MKKKNYECFTFSCVTFVFLILFRIYFLENGSGTHV